MFLFVLQHSKLAGMFGTEAAGADNTSYNSSPSHNFLTSVDDTLRADNLSPSSTCSSQGTPTRKNNDMMELKPIGSEEQLIELQPLKKTASNISPSYDSFVSAASSTFSSIQSDSSSPTYYNSLITPGAQAPEHFSGFYTPTATSFTYNSTTTTPTSASASYYSSMDGMTTPTSVSPSHYSSLNGLTTPISASPSYYKSLDGMTTPYTDYSQYSTPTSVNHPSLTPPFSTISTPVISNPFTQYSSKADTASWSHHGDNTYISPLSQNRITGDSRPLSAYRPNGESHVSTHIQHSAPRKYDTEYNQSNTSTSAGMTTTLLDIFCSLI